MIEVAASKSFTPASAPPRRGTDFALRVVESGLPRRAARGGELALALCGVFQIAIPRGTTAALFLTAWLIYLADRFVDSVSLDQRTAVSLRQRFCRRHRAAWIVAVSAVALADLLVVWRELDTLAVLVGCGVGGLALVYLLINQLRPSLWRLLPLKEISIGVIFAAGAMVGLLRGLPTVAFVPWIVFASLCALNCICIACWELGLDLAQRRISIATEFPQVNRLVVAAFCDHLANERSSDGAATSIAQRLDGDRRERHLARLRTRGP